MGKLGPCREEMGTKERMGGWREMDCWERGWERTEFSGRSSEREKQKKREKPGAPARPVLVSCHRISTGRGWGGGTKGTELERGGGRER